MRNIQLTEKVIQTLREMVCGVEINNDIQSSEYEIEKLKYKMSDIEYSELLKQLDKEKLQEIIQSRSVYDTTEALIERIKSTCNVEITDERVLNKLSNMQSEIDMRQRNIDKMYETLKDLTTYSEKIQEEIEQSSKEPEELFGIKFTDKGKEKEHVR
mgnify:FL=1